jgi:pyruvate-ferredoxin/flavodoxin oxidoreductase
MRRGLETQKSAVESGHFPLLRYDPRRAAAGENPLQLDSKRPSRPFADFADQQNRFKVLTKINPGAARRLQEAAQDDARQRWERYHRMASMTPGPAGAPGEGAAAGQGRQESAELQEATP